MDVPDGAARTVYAGYIGEGWPGLENHGDINSAIE
jgi:hypothetical protein